MAKIEASDADDYLPLCLVCIKKIMKMIPNNADRNDERLVYVSAALANYHLTLMRHMNGDCPESIEVGDVRVNTDNNKICESAKKLYEEALSCITDLVPDRSFYFRGV